MRPKPLALIILDGWGKNTEKNGNAVEMAHTPYLDQLFKTYPNTLLTASGEAVGLPEGQMGNSEVGHLNIGSGRIVYQDFTRISRAVKTGELKNNQVLNSIIKTTLREGKVLHLIGLLSDGGVHSHINHLFGLLELAKEVGLKEVYVHAILDGRDVPPKSAKKYIEMLETKLNELRIGKVASVSGRYYTMDRDQRWERVQKGYDAMVLGKGKTAGSPIEAVENAYQADETDEFVTPTVIVGENGNAVANINHGDSILFYNFRADRARQITRALALQEFKGFDRGEYLKPNFICMTEYDENFHLPIAFPPVEIPQTLAEVLSNNNLKQLRIAETEKYAHVTFFFNGGKEEPVKGEERILIPSPQVATYDLKPEMSAFEVTERLIGELKKDTYDLIILNYANCDMVGHTGVIDAAIKAIEVVDECLSKLIPVILDQGGQILLTSDHGNAEKMLAGDAPHTAHTTFPVPMIYVAENTDLDLRDGGILADLAPTILKILKIAQPEEMTGKSLLVNSNY